MPALLIRQKTAADTVWKPLDAEGSATLRANGCTGGWVFRNAADPDEIWILLEWDDLFRAHLFIQSDDMANALSGAEAADPPDVWFLDDERHLAYWSRGRRSNRAPSRPMAAKPTTSPSA